MRTTVSNCYLRNILYFCIFLFSSYFSNAQIVSGKIIRQCTDLTGKNILDPNNILSPDGYDALGNRYTSATIAGFGADDVVNSEIKYKPIPSFSLEPASDLRRGPKHLYSDYVPDANGASYYMHYDGTNLLFRMRLGSIIPGAKGYSILIDTDNKFGSTGVNADPNYLAATSGVNGNPGFEVEIVLLTQNANSSTPGIQIFNIDGKDNEPNGSAAVTYNNWHNYSQISLAATNDNGDPDFFVDWYIPFSALSGLTGLGITPSTTFRIIPTTVMSPQGAIGGPKSDIYGLDDANYKDPNAQYEAFINAQPSTTISSWAGTTTTSPISSMMCTAAPIVNSINSVGNVTVTGTWKSNNISTAANTATITIYKNGNPTGVTAIATSGLPWTTSTTISVAAGDKITAMAKADGESECYTSNMVVVIACTTPSDMPVEPVLACYTTNKGTSGSNLTAGWTIWTSNETRGTTENSSTTGSLFSEILAPNWKYSSGCSGGSNMLSGSYRFWYKDNATGCESNPVYVCVLGSSNKLMGNGPLKIPIVTSPANNVFTSSTKIISGTAGSGSTVKLYINGVLAQTATVSGTLSASSTSSDGSTGTAGNFTFSNVSLSVGDKISFVAEHTVSGVFNQSYCGSNSSTYTVVCYTTPPVINTNAVTGQLTIGQPITGTSSEPSGTTIKVYNSSNLELARTTVQDDGSWTTSGAILSNGFNGIAAANTTYRATAIRGTCVSVYSANVATGSGVTNNNRCGTISGNIPTGDITSGTTSITVSYSNATNLRLTLYEDGQLVATKTGLTGTNSTIFEVTNILYAGNGSNTGILSIGVQENGSEEFTCPATYKVLPSGCSAPTAIDVDPSGNVKVNSGSSITFNVKNPSTDAFYSVFDYNTGSALSNGIWTPSTSLGSIALTTIPFSSNTTAIVKASKMNNIGEVCSTITQASIMVLPVQLLEFQGKRENGGVLLSWTTEAEVNFSHYEIECSNDGSRFAKIGIKQGVNSQGRTTYNFKDLRPLQQVTYYRLRLVDIDGKFSYSKVIALNNSGESLNLSSIRPNPFQNTLSISLSLKNKQTIIVTLLDASGRIIKKLAMDGNKGLNEINFSDLASLPAGIYMLVIISEDNIIKQKVMKTFK